jgi:peptide methionine sulfoxide reductase MsrA
MKATFKHISSPKTGYAEAVHVEFDPNEVSLPRRIETS